MPPVVRPGLRSARLGGRPAAGSKKSKAPACIADHARAIVAAQGKPPRNTHRVEAANLLARLYPGQAPKDLTAIEVQAACGIILTTLRTPAARYCRIAGLKYVLRYLIDAGAPHAIMQAIPRIVPPRPRAITYTDEERRQLIEAAPPFMRCMILLCSDVALRSGTAMQVTPRHYDRDARTISIATKGGTHVTLPTTDALDLLFAFVGRAHLDTPFVEQLHGGKITQHGLQAAFAALSKSVGIRGKTLHDLRRTTAVRVMAITRDLRVVQHLLGHRNLDSTLYYLDHDTQSLDRDTLALATARKEDTE